MPSLDDLLAQSERVDRTLLAHRKEKRERLTTAQDDWGLVEVCVDSSGEVVEVAINAELAVKARTADLAEAMLQAARAAQARAKALR